MPRRRRQPPSVDSEARGPRLLASAVGADGDVGGASRSRRPAGSPKSRRRSPTRSAQLGHRSRSCCRAIAASPSTAPSASRRACASAIACSRSTFFERRLSDRVTAVLVDVPELFDRDGLYGNADGDYPDNALRFAVFSRAALEYARLREQRPSVIHAHDWQTGLVPVYQKMHLSTDPIVGGVPAVFTIHNLAFQGVFPPSTLARDRPRLRSARRAGAGVLGQHQLPEGRDQLQREDHDRQPELREGDRPARARLRLRRHPRPGGPTTWSASSTASTPSAGIRRPTRSCRRRSAPTTSAGSATRSGRCSRPSACRPTMRRWRGRSSAWSRG